MEYRGYTPDEVKKDKRKKMVGIILLIFPILFGLFSIVGGVIEIISIKVDDVSTLSYNDLSAGDEYYFSEMVLVDVYAHYKDTVTGHVENNYYIVSFVDGDGTRVYTSVSAKPSSKLGQKCEAYIKDDSLTVGDVILSGCFHGYENGYSVQSYFEQAYTAYSADLPGERLDWYFSYDDVETIEEYRSNEISKQSIYFSMGLVPIIPCVIGILILVRKRKELDRYIEEYYRSEPSTEYTTNDFYQL